jgi:hypothetical protein
MGPYDEGTCDVKGKDGLGERNANREGCLLLEAQKGKKKPEAEVEGRVK